MSSRNNSQVKNYLLRLYSAEINDGFDRGLSEKLDEFNKALF